MDDLLCMLTFFERWVVYSARQFGMLNGVVLLLEDFHNTMLLYFRLRNNLETFFEFNPHHAWKWFGDERHVGAVSMQTWELSLHP